MRQPNAKSPDIERQQSQRKMVHRKTDANAEDFMRFIREYQHEKQPTHLRLQKRAPLPSIGKSVSFNHHDSRPTVRRHRVNNSYGDESIIENEIAMLHHKHKSSADPRNDPVLQEVLTLTRERTKDHIILSSISNGRGVGDINRNSLTRQDSDIFRKGNIAPKPLQNFRATKSKKSRKLLKQLPPIVHEDLDLPDRPSAPSPSVTPPHPDDSDDDSFIIEEPIDYIDVSL